MTAVAFLDLATTTGFASRSESGLVTSGTFKLPKTGDDMGWFLSAFHEWLVDYINLFDRSALVLVYEAPFVGNAGSVPKLFNLAGHTEFVCKRLGVWKCFAVDNSAIRSHFIGVTRGGRAMLKNKTIEECRRRGFKPADDNEADAIAGLDYAAHILKLPNLETGGLFAATQKESLCQNANGKAATNQP